MRYNYKHSKEKRLKISESNKLVIHSPMSLEHKLKISESLQKYYALGGKAPMTGKKHSDDTKKKMHDIHIKLPPSTLGYKHSDITKKKYSEATKRKWENPEYAKKVLCVDSPNKQERRLLKILDDNFLGQWSFVGNGQLKVGRKYPDFKSTSKNKLIELYGDFYHWGQNPEDRIKYFKEFGYECVVIWASELSNTENIINRITKFANV